MEGLSVAVIILNYNSIEDTRHLIKSVKKHEKKIRPHIYIIDNASNDAEELAKEIIDGCEVVLLSENNGYAAGNNYGIRKAIEEGYNYVVIANSDTEIIEDNTIYSLICAMKKNNAFIIGPEILNANNKATSGAGWVSRFGKVYEKLTVQPKWCQCIVGAFFVLDKRLIENVGFMKENYFLYLEETDFFLNCFRKGFKVLYFPHIHIVHYCGKTTSKVYDYYISRNRFLLAENNYKTPHLVMIIYLLFVFMVTDIKQFVACKVGIRDYNYKYRRKMRWIGYFDGVKRIDGKNSKL